MSHPWLSQLILYGCGCGVVGNFNLFMTSTEIRFFGLLLSTMKCSEVPFTHIFEWNRCSPSSNSSSSFGWIIVVVMVTLGSTPMTHIPLSSYKLKCEPRYDSKVFSSPTNYYFEWHPSLLCQGLLWKSHHFPMPLFIFPSPSLLVA